MDKPEKSVGTIFDVRLDNGHFYRTAITDYNSNTKQFTMNSGQWDNWGNQPVPLSDLNTLGSPDSLDTVPRCYAIKFNPISSPENIGKFYRSRGKFKIIDDLQSLESDLFSGCINSCPHNGNVARRYVSAFRRESNANRHGVT